MKTSTFVRDSADVVRIVELQPGDVYKRYVENPSYGEASLQFGVVQAVMNNGSTAAITAIEFSALSYAPDVKVKVFGDSQDLALFPANPDEVAVHLTEVRKAVARSIKDVEKELENKRFLAGQVESVFSTRASLTAAATEAGEPLSLQA